MDGRFYNFTYNPWLHVSTLVFTVATLASRGGTVQNTQALRTGYDSWHRDATTQPFGLGIQYVILCTYTPTCCQRNAGSLRGKLLSATYYYRPIYGD
jgi:hypothetical protein